METKNIFFIYLILWWGISISLNAELKINSAFQHNMVLQQDQPINIFGTSDPGSRVKVSFNGKSSTVKTEDNGEWVATFRKMRSTSKGSSIFVKAKQKTGMAEREIKNVQVGDVWLFAGGGNIEYDFTKHSSLKKKYVDFLNDDIRGFGFSKYLSEEPYDEVKIDYKFRHEWRSLKEEYAEAMTPLAMFFGAKVNEYLDCPVGLIKCGYKNSRIDAWIPQEDLKTAGFNPVVSKNSDGNINVNHSSSIYNGMINPIKKLSIRGVIWYPGEEDIRNPVEYAKMFKTLITSWRKAFNNEEMPFLFVQAQSTARPSWNTSGEALAWFREAQAQALELPNTYMTTTIDLGEEKSFITEDHKEIAERLALHVLKMKRSKTVDSGPTFKKLSAAGYKITIDFDNADSGLTAKKVVIEKNAAADIEEAKEEDKKEAKADKADEPVKVEGTVLPEDKVVGFEICGRDGVFHPADAKLLGRSVEIFSNMVRRPAAVRYNWSSITKGNLFNEDGLPAVPFRTDKLPAPGFEGELESREVTITSIIGQPLEPLLKVGSYAMEKVKVGEVDAYKVIPPKGKSDYAAFFKNGNSDLKDGKKPKLKVMVVFYDEGSGIIEIEYDSNDPKIVISKNKPGMYKTAGKIKLTGTNTWRFVEIDLGDALFSSRLSGADIRLKSKEPYRISGVYVHPL